MTLPLVSLALASGIFALQQVLMLSAGMHRAKAGIAAGYSKDIQLERKVRRHANLAENSALFFLILAFAEMVGVAPAAISTVGGIFVAARLAHVLAFASTSGSHFSDDGKFFKAMRALGAFGTLIASFLLIALIAGWFWLVPDIPFTP